MEFIPAIFPSEEVTGESIWFAFSEGRLLMLQDEYGVMVPQIAHFSDLGIVHRDPHYLGKLEGQHCFAVMIEPVDELPEGFFLKDLRTLAREVDTHLFMLAGRARQIVEWDNNHRFAAAVARKPFITKKTAQRNVPIAATPSIPVFPPALSSW